MAGNALIPDLKKAHSSMIRETVEFRGEQTVIVDASQLHGFLKACFEAGFDYLVDISSLDHMGEDPRFEVVYELYSYSSHEHLRVRSEVPEESCTMPTAIDIWPTADWHEREIYDMMGILFSDHPDLRRILMWDGYPFYPLRKDFPLEGKESELPDVAFTGKAPLAGGPFVTSPGAASVKGREPRAKSVE
ncbi:MAG: NADH-quinone oxidoreductase subunit C [Verrucomicrobiota bacterium]